MVTESVDFRYRADEVEIPRARRDMRRFLNDHWLASDVVDDLTLVLAELMTNAVEYGTGVRVVVELDIRPNVVSVAVMQTGGADLGDPSTWIMPPKASTSGRGLALVRTLADGVEWSATGSQMKVRADRRYGED